MGKLENTNFALGPQGTAPEEAGASNCDSPESKNWIKRRATTLLLCYIVQAYHIYIALFAGIQRFTRSTETQCTRTPPKEQEITC